MLHGKGWLQNIYQQDLETRAIQNEEGLQWAGKKDWTYFASINVEGNQVFCHKHLKIISYVKRDE